MASSTSNERSSLLGGQGTTNIPDNLSTPVVYGTETRTDGVLEQTVVPGGGTHMHGTTPDVTVIGRPTLFWAVAISTMFSSCLHLVFYANMGMLFKKKDEDKTFLLYVLSW
ncbi:hypothetical protein FA15DRAFT_143243 [Coprinopsis marcescibilis]|uniref:Uncharacterized protein n=1 Tax=Coprinopsis marcescibilis TaxID=230819 RepID=A0A5C3KIT3_COPMA|nr:hypothetical protein FA15DRAFT_143243 [Coprinopsis marcescibilis]